ncbi:non-specific lipid transfer protein GPI-anchored 30 [Benincasa hispida]|uniref:non-specific lipid transfer protein GPI-anchored 30 n=1 Tax=Benincasa hispida TaxID=102211 RepID=UPI0018FFF932|nr:non-specific lipid transfer protein GPI-anchored 30 [Benincasa hispida]
MRVINNLKSQKTIPHYSERHQLDHPPNLSSLHLFLLLPTLYIVKFINTEHRSNQLTKKSMEIRSAMAKMIVLLAVVGCATMGMAQNQDTSCVNRLIPCLNYLNGTGDPPESCCNPLRSIIDSNPDCLCGLISREGSNRAEAAGIDINQAQLLPARCGEHVNPLSCLTANNAGLPSMSSTLQVITLATSTMLIMPSILHF